MSKLQILIGMIASGKSSYCKNAARQGIICMNDDAIVNMLHGDEYTLYDKDLKPFYKSIENHIVASALLMKRTIIVDRGLSISVKGRKRWIALAKSFDVPCEAIVFKNEGPEVHAKRRHSSDARGHDYDYWLKVSSKHFENYEAPSLLEGLDSIYQVSFEEIKSGKIF